MHQLASNVEFLNLWNKLLRYSKRYKISHEDLEDIVSESIVKALEYLNEDRGSFESLCLVIIKNKVFNFTRDNKFLFLLVLIDDADEIIEPDTKTFEDKEQNIIALKFIDKLKKKLDEEELILLNAFYELCESSEKPNISKASRLIGLEPNKGWDIFRRIQRKAEINKYENIIEETEIYVSDFRKMDNISKMNISSKYNKSFDSLPIEKTPELNIPSGYKKFIESLSKEDISNLEKLYNY